MSRTSSVRLKLPQVVTYVTRLPIPSSPSRTSVSFVNQSSTATHDRRSSSAVTSAFSPSPKPACRRVVETSAGQAEPGGEVDGSPRPQQRRPSAIRSTLSCSQLLGLNSLHGPPAPALVTVKSNPALMPHNDEQLRDGPARRGHVTDDVT